MPVTTLVATAGSASANTYILLADANQYHEDRPAVGTTWASASDDQKNRSLLWATKLMDSLWEWEGWQTDPLVQALQWPRVNVLYRDGQRYIEDNVIPLELGWAVAEYARQLLASDLAGNSAVETQGITSLTAGPVTLQFKADVKAKPVPDTVRTLIPPLWGRVRGTSGVKRLVRV